jgi:hypothetical protein
MKNLKRFDELNEGGKVEIWPEVDAAFSDINALHLLMDEGYFDHHGFPKADLADVNAFMKENGLSDGDYFESDAKMESFTSAVKASMQELASKL